MYCEICTLKALLLRYTLKQEVGCYCKSELVLPTEEHDLVYIPTGFTKSCGCDDRYRATVAALNSKLEAAKLEAANSE